MSKSKWISGLAIGFAWVALASAQVPAPPTSAEPGAIILYKTSNWTGDSLTIREREISNLGELGWDNSVRSFTVVGGTWYLYRDGNYWGQNPHDVFGAFTATNGVSGSGNHTFGDNPDGPSGNTTSLRGCPTPGRCSSSTPRAVAARST